MADSLSPSERSLRSRIGAFKLHATHDPRETTKAARSAFLSRFEPDDPDLSPEERARRTLAAKKAHFSLMAYRSARARSRPTSTPADAARSESNKKAPAALEDSAEATLPGGHGDVRPAA